MPAGGLTSGLDAAALFAPLAEFSPIGLAVSGGPDSLALMLLAHRLGPERFVVYTVDHGLRPEAAEEAAMVVREAEMLGFRARSLRWDGTKPQSGVQEAARAARYRLIGEAMRADNAVTLVTAHHIADQAETVLMRLAHGSGIEGLRGMDRFAHVEGVRIFRPLLDTDPADLRALVDAAGLTPAADPSNLDPTYERVRWREALPTLAALGLDARRIAQFAERAGDADRAIEAAARAALADVIIDGEPAAIIECAKLVAAPRAVAIRVLQHVLKGVGGSRRAAGLGAVERLADRLVREPLAVTLHGCVIRSDGETIRIAREPLTGARGRAAERHEDVT